MVKMKLKEMYKISLKKWKVYLDKSKKTKNEVLINSTCHFCEESRKINISKNICSDCRANRHICDEIWGAMETEDILFVIELIEKEIKKLK